MRFRTALIIATIEASFLAILAHKIALDTYEIALPLWSLIVIGLTITALMTGMLLSLGED